MEDGRCLLDVISDADALTNFLDAELCQDEQDFSVEDLQGALPDTFAWSPPSSPSAFLPQTTSSTLENLVDGEVGSSFHDAMAPSATPVATVAPRVAVGVTNLAYPSTSSSSAPLPLSSTPTSSTVAPAPSPVTTVHYHGHSGSDGGSGQEGGGGSGGGGILPTYLTNLPSQTTTSTTQASRTPSPATSLATGVNTEFDQQQLQHLQLQLQQLKQQEAQLLLQQQQAMLSRQQQPTVQTTTVIGGQSNQQQQQVQQQQQPVQQQPVQQQPQQVVVGSSGLQIIPQAALLQQGQVGQIGQIGQVGQLSQLGQYTQVGQLAPMGQIGQGGQMTNVSQSPQPPKAPTPVSTQPLQVQPKPGGVVYASQAQTFAIAQQTVQQQQQQVVTIAQQMQQQQQTVALNPQQNPSQSVTLAPQLTQQQQQLAQLAQQQIIQQQQQQQQPQQHPQILPQPVTIGTSQAGTPQLQNNLLLSTVRPSGSLPGTVQVRPQGNVNLVQGTLPTGVSLQGTIIQTSNGNRILLQAPPLMAAGHIAAGQLTNLQAGVPFQPQSISSSTATTSATATQQQPLNVGTISASGGKPVAVGVGQPTQQVLNIAGGQPGQQQQIVIQRTPGPNGTQNQNIILRTIPSNLIQFQGSVVPGVSTATTTTTGGANATIGSQSSQVVLSQGGGIPTTGQIQLPQGQVATIGQPQVLGGLNMVNNAHSININVLPAPLQNLQGIQQAVQSAANLPGSVSIQPKPPAVTNQQQTMTVQNPLVTQSQSPAPVATAATTMVTSQLQQQQVHLADSGNIKLNAGGVNVAAQQLSIQQLQSLGLLPANLGQLASSQAPTSSGTATAPQATVNNSMAQILQTVTATVEKQVTNASTSQMHTMVLTNPGGLQGQNATLHTVPGAATPGPAVSVALTTTPSSGQQLQSTQTLNNLQTGHQVVLGPGAGGAQIQNIGQLPLLKPKTEPRSNPSPQIPQQLPTPPPSAKTPIVNLTAGAPLVSPVQVSAATQASKVLQTGNIPATISSLPVKSHTPNRSRNSTTTTAASPAASAGLPAKPVSISTMGLQNIQNVSAPPNVNIQNMPQLQVKNLSQLPAVSGTFPSTSQTATTTSSIAHVVTTGSGIPIRPKTSQIPLTVNPVQPQRKHQQIQQQHQTTKSHKKQQQSQLPIISQTIQGQIPVSQLPSQLAQLQSQLGSQQIKVQTVQLSQQSQDLLKTIQSKIKAFLNIKNRTEVEQRNLQKLMDMQQKILLEGSIALQQQLQQQAKLQQQNQPQQQQQIKQEPGVVKCEPGVVKMEPGTSAQFGAVASAGGVPVSTMNPASSQVVRPANVTLSVTNAQMQQQAPGAPVQLRSLGPQTAMGGKMATAQLRPLTTGGVSSGGAVTGMPTTVTFSTTAAATAGGKVHLLPSGTPVKVAGLQIPPQVQEKLKAQLSKMTPDQQQEYIRQQLPVLIQLQQQAMRQQQQQQLQQQKAAQKQAAQGQQQPQPVVAATPTATTATTVIPQPATQTLGAKGKIPITVQQVAGNVTIISTGLPGQASTLPKSVVSTATTTTTTAKPTIIKRPLAQAIPKPALFQRQLTQDQTQALQPDLKTPFKSRKDAIMRLIRYHVFSSVDPPQAQVVQEETQYEELAQDLLERKQQMLNKYRLLLYDDAMRLEQTSEMVMLERMFIQDERERLEEEQATVKDDPDKFVPCPIIKDSSDEEDISAQAQSKKIKLEPVDEFTIKQEKTDDESKMGSSPSYTLHSTGGLKIVIKNSPVHMKSPAHITDLALTQPEKIKEEFKSPRKKRDRGSPRGTPLRSPTASPMTSPLASPFRSPQYRTNTPDRLGARSEGGVKIEPGIDDEEDEVVFDGVVPFTNIKSRNSQRTESQPYDVTPQRDSSEGHGYSSSQDEGETSEADAAVAGLLSSTGMDTDDDLPELLSPGVPKRTKSTRSFTGVGDSSYGEEMTGESMDYVSGVDPASRPEEGSGEGELTAAVDSLMADFHDISGSSAAGDHQDVQPTGSANYQQLMHQSHDTQQQQTRHPHYHSPQQGESYSFDESRTPFDHTAEQQQEQMELFQDDSADIDDGDSGALEELFGDREQDVIVSSPPPPSRAIHRTYERTSSSSSHSDRSQRGSLQQRRKSKQGKRSRQSSSGSEEHEPSLNAEMQSAINSILSLQQTDALPEGFDSGEPHPFAPPGTSAEGNMCGGDSYDLYGTPSGDTQQDSDPMQDDLDAAVQSILM